MDDSTIFIIGANGQLGSALKEQYPDARTADVGELDITDADSVNGYDWSGIKVIINAAAYTNVDGAETVEGRVAAWKVNAVAVANLVVTCDQNDITLVHISSDYVFDGTQDPHTEDESFAPLGVYAQTKAAGDIAVGMLSKHYILRTSWVIGNGGNFVRTMLGLGKKGISPSVVCDQVGRLTFTTELVKAVDHLLVIGTPFGTYNVSNSGDSVSWADITRTIYHEADYSDLTVTDVTTADYYADKPGIAPRPLLSTLSLDKIQATGFVSTDWHDDLRDYISKEETA